MNAATRQTSYKKKGDFVIKSSPPVALKKQTNVAQPIKKPQSREASNRPNGATKIGMTNALNINTTGYVSREPIKPSFSHNDMDDRIDLKKYEMKGRIPSSIQDVPTEKETVSKEKYDALKENYESLLKKFEETKKKLRETEANYRYEVARSKDTLEENKLLKQKLKEAQNKPKPPSNSRSHPNEETKGDHRRHDEDLRSLQLALRYEAENYLMNQLAFMHLQQGDIHHPPQQNRSIDLNNPESINPDNMTYEQLLELEEKMGKVSKGLPEEEFNKIPETKFYKSTAKKDDAQECSICFVEYTTGDKLKKLACNHSYHSDCIKQWFGEQKTCPVCKSESVVPQN